MNMQDKEMDALFRSKLDDYEIEPSPMVWANISEELGNPGKRKSIIPMLRIAASVAIVIGAGAYFWPKQQGLTKTDQRKLTAGVANTGLKTQPANAPKNVHVAQPVNTATQAQPIVKTQLQRVYASVSHHQAVQQSPVVNTAPVVDPKSTDIVTDAQTPQNIAAVTNTQPGNVQTVTNAITAGAGVTPVVPETKLSVTSTDVINQPVTIASVQSESKKRNKIRGLGGLLNAAIGLVDRREDKVIEFTNNEDGDTITGINLGVVAIKKNNK